MLRSPETIRWYPWVSMASVLGTWEIVVYLSVVPRYLLPAPSHILIRLWQEFSTPTLWFHTITTVAVAITGIGISFMLAITSAWLFYHVPVLRACLGWIYAASQSLPVVAIAPLLLLWIASPFWARTMVAVLITTYPMFSAASTALRVIPYELREVALLNGASWYDMIVYVEWPLSRIVLLSGVQTSVVIAMTGAVVGEYLGGRYGLGALINIARGTFDVTLVFVALMVLVTVTVIAHAGIQLIQKRAMQQQE